MLETTRMPLRQRSHSHPPRAPSSLLPRELSVLPVQRDAPSGADAWRAKQMLLPQGVAPAATPIPIASRTVRSTSLNLADIRRRDAVSRRNPYAWRSCNHCDALVLQPFFHDGTGVFCSGECGISYGLQRCRSNAAAALSPTRHNRTQDQERVCVADAAVAQRARSLQRFGADAVAAARARRAQGDTELIDRLSKLRRVRRVGRRGGFTDAPPPLLSGEDAGVASTPPPRLSPRACGRCSGRRSETKRVRAPLGDAAAAANRGGVAEALMRAGEPRAARGGRGCAK